MSTTAVTEVARPADYPDVAMYIDGEWVQGAAGRGDDVVNPATGRASTTRRTRWPTSTR